MTPKTSKEAYQALKDYLKGVDDRDEVKCFRSLALMDNWAMRKRKRRMSAPKGGLG